MKFNKNNNCKLEDKEIIVVSIPRKGHISLEKRFKEYKGKNLAKEFVWDEPRGKEIISDSKE